MFFDIGANVGNWTLSNINNCDKIISVEASPITYNKLKNNCNNEKIVPLNYAVCNNGGKDIDFYIAKCDTLSTLNKDWLNDTKSRFYGAEHTKITCKTITIDELINQYGIPYLIKIDVEGGEYECISSLTKKVNVLCFEWASEVNDITFKCLDHLFSLGFTKFCIQSGDNYTFRPQDSDYYDITLVKKTLSNTIPKIDWGMIWCK